MKTSVTGRNLELTDRLRGYIEQKMGRLDRIAHRQSEASVELISNASHSADEAHVAEVTLSLNGDVLRSESSGATPKAAFDTVLDKLERQIVRHNEKPRHREKSAAELQVLAEAAIGTVEPDRPVPSIVRIKRFDMEPMFEEDAVARMEELQHAFFVFLNAETDAICVLYRRRDGDYGLIQPVVGPPNSRGGGR